MRLILAVLASIGAVALVVNHVLMLGARKPAPPCEDEEVTAIGLTPSGPTVARK